jgi:hypothetical protein
MERSREYFIEVARQAFERAEQIASMLEDDQTATTTHVELLALTIVVVSTMSAVHRSAKHIPNVENLPVDVHAIANSALNSISELIHDQIAASAAGN